MKAPALRIARPETVEEAIELAANFGDDAKFIAGGQSLVPTLNLRLSSPSMLIDLAALPDMNGIAAEKDELVVRACTTYAATATHSKVRDSLPVLVEGIGHVAHPAIRNVGTLGGSLALSDPAAEMPAMAVALGAGIKVLGAKGSRVVPAESFFKGLYETDMAAGELIREVRWPTGRWDFWRFQEIARRRGDFATAGVIMLASAGTAGHLNVRICVFGVSSKPCLLPKTSSAVAEAVLHGKDAEEAVADACSELEIIGDSHTTAETKEHLTRVLLARNAAAMTELYRERL